MRWSVKAEMNSSILAMILSTSDTRGAPNFSCAMSVIALPFASNSCPVRISSAISGLNCSGISVPIRSDVLYQVLDLVLHREQHAAHVRAHVDEGLPVVPNRLPIGRRLRLGELLAEGAERAAILLDEFLGLLPVHHLPGGELCLQPRKFACSSAVRACSLFSGRWPSRIPRRCRPGGTRRASIQRRPPRVQGVDPPLPQHRHRADR